jgi:hypothetical protein
MQISLKMNATVQSFFSMCELLTHRSGQVKIKEMVRLLFSLSLSLSFACVTGAASCTRHIVSFFFIARDYRQMRENDDEI